MRHVTPARVGVGLGQPWVGLGNDYVVRFVAAMPWTDHPGSSCDVPDARSMQRLNRMRFRRPGNVTAQAGRGNLSPGCSW
jgi:hypothetical protein